MDVRKIAVLLGGYDVGSGITTYYPFDESSGVLVKDHSQYDNDGTLKNGPVWGPVDGVMGLTFDGVDDYIEDSKGRHIVREGTTGFWSEVKIGDETKIVGTGTIFYFSNSGVDLEGQFVEDFADFCTTLVHFECNANAFSGVLPSFAGCTSLVNFQCQTNNFTGVLPSFAACTSLANFYCNANEFTGVLPSFDACTSLINFSCGTNDFTGVLPSFATCTSLGTFYCFNNAFTGVLPPFAACTSLTGFYCHTNEFSGVLPSFAACTSLANFQCQTNNFTGVLPSFAACTSLAHFYCNTNAFTGVLPSFAACTSLTNFSCGTNDFTGVLPSFAACTSLGTFYCGSNEFSGYTVGGFVTQISLTTLDLRYNAIAAAADINAILADLRTSYDLVGRVACTVKLEGGTNAAPTGQGITDKTFLNANGWTVTTN